MAARKDRSPRQRLDVDERREAILSAAAELYSRASYPAVSVAEIAQAAGASPALVFHYFGSKASLYAAVVEDDFERLMVALQVADDHRNAGAPARERVRTSLQLYLEHVAHNPTAWAARLLGGGEPAEALEVRRRARAAFVAELGALLQTAGWRRHEYALWGYFGFLDEVCLHWVAAGCPEEERDPLLNATLGALEGALGDWGG